MRWFSDVILAAAFCAFAVGAPPAARAEGASDGAAVAPVSISACAGGVTSVELVEVATYDVTLHNASSIPVDEIRLSVRYGRLEKRATFDIKGPFVPGADVSRHLRRTVNGGLFGYWSDHNDCFIDSIRFANGTTWNRPSLQPPAR